MTQLPALPAGIYRHYKNHLYQVIGYGCDANNRAHIMVFYLGLELMGAQPGTPRLSARTAVSDDPKVDAWWDFVHSDGTKCLHKRTGAVCAISRPVMARFTYLGTTYQSSQVHVQSSS